MALTKLLTDLAYISKLADEPNDVGGYSAAQLKAEFDRAAQEIQTYINSTLIPELQGEGGAGSVGLASVDGLTGISTVQAAIAQIIVKMGEISQGAVADNSITAAKLKNGAVTEYKLGDGAVAEAKLKNGAVTEDKLGDGAVSAAAIAALAVTTSALAELAVTEAKIANLAVTNAKLANNAVSTAKIDALAVTGPKIASGAVSKSKLAVAAVSADKVEADAKTQWYIITLPTAWSGSSAPYTATVTQAGILATDIPILHFHPPDTYNEVKPQESEYNKLFDIEATADNTLVFRAHKPLNVAINVAVEVARI